MFPSLSNFHSVERKVSPGYVVKEVKKSLKRKPSLKETTKEALKTLNNSFVNTYGVTFEESLVTTNSNLIKKPTYEETRSLKKKTFP